MMDFWSITHDLLQAVVLMFTCLSLGVAWNRARVHLAWLVPLTLGQFLSLVGSLSNLFVMNYIYAHHVPLNQASGLFISQQIVYSLSILAALWFAIALFFTLRSQAAVPRPPDPMQAPGPHRQVHRLPENE